MNKKIVTLVLLTVMYLVGCGNKEENQIQNQIQKTDISDKQDIEMVENFAGFGGYIVQDLVFDYSNRFDNVYEWCDGVKLPIEKFDADKIELIEGTTQSTGVYALVEASGFLEEDFFAYLETVEKDGYNIAYNDAEALDAYYLYKDNLMFAFMYVNTGETLRVSVYVITGNVKENNMIDTKTAREIIDSSELIKQNDNFSEYMLMEIANETVKEAGYVEYLIISPKNYNSHEKEVLPYYVVMKDEEIVFCEQGAASVIYPSNANIIVDEDGQEKLIISCLEYPMSTSSISYKGCIRTYLLKDGKFEKDDSVEDVILDNTLILSTYEDGELKYFTLKENENFDGKKGYRDKWILGEEYEMNK